MNKKGPRIGFTKLNYQKMMVDGKMNQRLARRIGKGSIRLRKKKVSLIALQRRK
jgi:hypothetical protein